MDGRIRAWNLTECARDQRWNIVALDLGIDLSTPSGEFMASVLAAWPAGSAGSPVSAPAKGCSSQREGEAARSPIVAATGGAGPSPH